MFTDLSMNLITSYFLFLLYELKLSKSELLNPREMQKVLNLTKVTNKDELSKCETTWNKKLYPEIPYVYLFCNANLEPVRNKPEGSYCSGFDCWESQLSLVSRVEIVRIMNQYREKVSKDNKCNKWCRKNKKKIIFELRWDRAIEDKAIDLIQKCPSTMKNSTTSTVTVSDGKEVTSRTDISATSFKMELGTQNELRIILWRLMSENHLNDWDEGSSQFRRSLMHDVGCAFVVRRGVNYDTALGENVKNGIVGHIVCVYQSFLPSEQPPDSTSASLSSCKSLSGYVQVDFGDYNYFPNLCRIDPQIDATVLNNPAHSCAHGPKNIKNLCPSSDYSADTWDEKFYGLIIKLVNPSELEVTVDCNVPHDIPQFEKQGDNVYNYFCTLKEKVLIRPDNTSECAGWDCEESHLTDITRIKILKQLNKARNLVASGQCSNECLPPCEYCNKSIHYCNMAKLWHWFLEQKAAQLVRNCSMYYEIKTDKKKLIYEDNPFPDPVAFEEITMVFEAPPSRGGQIAIDERFAGFFWTNKQKDWSDDNQFRRGNAAFFGCSVIVRPNTGSLITETNGSKVKRTKFHMVCIYAALQEKFTSVSDGQNRDPSCCPSCPGPEYETRPCPVRYQTSIDPYPALCTSIALEITMSCQDRSYCKDQGHSKAWLEKYDGMTIYQKVDGSFERLIPKQTSTSSFSERKREIFIILLLFLLLLLLLCCLLTACSVYVYRWRMKKRREKISSDKPAAASKSGPLFTTQPTRPSAKTPATSTQKPITFETTIPTRATETTSIATTQSSEMEDEDEDDYTETTTTTRKPKTRLVPQFIRKVPKHRAHLYQ